jgi:predicted glycosyltransferase
MNNTELTFDLSNSDHVRAFAQLIREINETGVPYDSTQNGLTVTVKIGDGY